MNAFEKISQLKFPSQALSPSLISKWNHREVSLIVGSAFLIMLFLAYHFSRKPTTNTVDNEQKKAPDIAVQLPNFIGLSIPDRPHLTVKAKIELEPDKGCVHIKEVKIGGSFVSLEDSYYSYLAVLCVSLGKLSQCSNSGSYKPIIHAHSLKELVIYAGLGFGPSGSKTELQALIKKAESTEDLKKLFKHESFPVELVELEEVQWKEILLEGDPLKNYIDKVDENWAFVNRVLGLDRIQKFDIISNGKKAGMEVRVSTDNPPTLLLASLKAEGSETEVALDPFLTKRQKFWLYTEAAKSLVQYSKRFSHPKSEGESIQEYVDSDCEVAMEIHSPEAMNIVWRLGLVSASAYQGVQDILDKINPQRKQQFDQFKSSIEKETKLNEQELSPFLTELYMEAACLLDSQEKMKFEHMMSQTEGAPTSEKAEIIKKLDSYVLQVLVERAPFSLTDEEMQRTNAEVAAILKEVSYPQRLQFLPSASLSNISPEQKTFPAGIVEELEMWAKSYEIEGESKKATIEKVDNEFFSSVSSTPKKKKVTKEKLSPSKKTTLPEGLLSGDQTDPKFIVHYDGQSAWMKITKRRKELILEGLYRITGEGVASTVVADDLDVHPRDKILLYAKALFNIYKYSAEFPLKTEKIRWKGVPVIQAQTREEAALYSHLSFAPASKREEFITARKNFENERNRKQAELMKAHPAICASIEEKRKRVPPSTELTEDEVTYLSQCMDCQSTSPLWDDFWKILGTATFPETLVYYPQQNSPWKDAQSQYMDSIPDRYLQEVKNESGKYFQATMGRNGNWVLKDVEEMHKNRSTRAVIEIDKNRRQIALKAFHIEGGSLMPVPVASDRNLPDDEKFHLYIQRIAKLYTKNFEGVALNGLPLLVAQSLEEVQLLYYLGFVPSGLKDRLEGAQASPLETWQILACQKEYPTPLVNFGKKLRSWIAFHDKPFHRDLCQDFLAQIDLYSKAKVAWSENEKKKKEQWGLLEVTVTNISATKQVLEIANSTLSALLGSASVSVTLSKSDEHQCAMIEKISGIMGLPPEIAYLASSAILYATMKRSWEWGYEGIIKALWGDDEQDFFLCTYAQFHSPKMSAAIFPQKDSQGSPKKRPTDAELALLIQNDILEPNNFERETKARNISPQVLESIKGCYPQMRKYAKAGDFERFHQAQNPLYQLGVTGAALAMEFKKKLK